MKTRTEFLHANRLAPWNRFQISSFNWCDLTQPNFNWGIYFKKINWWNNSSAHLICYLAVQIPAFVTCISKALNSFFHCGAPQHYQYFATFGVRTQRNRLQLNSYLNANLRTESPFSVGVMRTMNVWKEKLTSRCFPKLAVASVPAPHCMDARFPHVSQCSLWRRPVFRHSVRNYLHVCMYWLLPIVVSIA